MQSIVELSNEYSPAAISQVMQRAVEFKSFGYGVLKRILARQALISKAYESVSLIVTSNLDFSEWGTLFSTPSTAAAVLDRFCTMPM